MATKRSRMEKKKKYGKNILRGELDLSRERDGEKERTYLSRVCNRVDISRDFTCRNDEP